MTNWTLAVWRFKIIRRFWTWLWSQCPILCFSAQKACIHTGKLEVWSGSRGPACFPGASRPQVCLSPWEAGIPVLLFWGLLLKQQGEEMLQVLVAFQCSWNSFGSLLPWIVLFFCSLPEVINCYIRGNALVGGRGFYLGSVEFWKATNPRVTIFQTHFCWMVWMWTIVFLQKGGLASVCLGRPLSRSLSPGRSADRQIQNWQVGLGVIQLSPFFHFSIFPFFWVQSSSFCHLEFGVLHSSRCLE